MRTNSVRKRGLELQRRVTVWVVAVSTVLAGIFAGVAAATGPGNNALRRLVGTPGSSSPQQQPSSQQESDDGLAPAAPAQAPSQSSLPPVASSGGS